MYWIHGKAQFGGDVRPKTYVLYGPFSSQSITRRALAHIKETIAHCGGIDLNYSVSRKKVLDI